MSVINELIRTEANGTLSFGNYSLAAKSKVEDFEHEGDLYKVKTFKEITKLERNGMFVYESVPGTAVKDFAVTDTTVTFKVEGFEDAQITVQLEDDCEYEVFEDGVGVGGMKTNMSGKLSLSVELNEGREVEVNRKIRNHCPDRIWTAVSQSAPGIHFGAFPVQGEYRGKSKKYSFFL